MLTLLEQLTLSLRHPISAARDHEVVLQRRHVVKGAEPHYYGELSQRLEHRWYWRIRPVDVEPALIWQLEGDIDFAQTAGVTVAPR